MESRVESAVKNPSSTFQKIDGDRRRVPAFWDALRVPAKHDSIHGARFRVVVHGKAVLTGRSWGGSLYPRKQECHERVYAA